MAGLSRPAEWTTEESEVVVTVAKRVERSASRGASAESVGRSVPLGATVVEGGVNFSLFSRNAAGVELLFFDREDDATPSRTVRVEPSTNRTYHYWHVFVPRVPPGQFFAHAQRRATGCRSGGRNRERARWFQRNLRTSSTLETRRRRLGCSRRPSSACGRSSTTSRGSGRRDRCGTGSPSSGRPGPNPVTGLTRPSATWPQSSRVWDATSSPAAGPG